MTSAPSGTVTFLFTDIEGSTALWERWADAMKAALGRHHALLNAAASEHHGYVFQIVGDAFCIAFGSAPDALGTALTAQRALRAETWGATGPLRVRMALHTGSAQPQDGQYASNRTFNRISRLLSSAHGGQILVTLATEELLRDHLPSSVGLHDLGQRRLRDVIHPERIFQVTASDLPSEFPPVKLPAAEDEPGEGTTGRVLSDRMRSGPMVGRSDLIQ
jgi:class 3 adenylate cyclase